MARRFLKRYDTALSAAGLIVITILVGIVGFKHVTVNASQPVSSARAKKQVIAQTAHLQPLSGTLRRVPASVSTTVISNDKTATTDSSATAANLPAGSLRLAYGQPVPQPPILFQAVTISDPKNCQTFPVDTTLIAYADTVLTYHTEFTAGGRTPSQQLAFKKGEVKTIHVDVPYSVPATDRQISGVFTFVLESPEYRTQVTNLSPGLFNICNSYPDNPRNAEQ